MAKVRAQVATAMGTTPREQLRWLLEEFLPADLTATRRDGQLGTLFFALSSLVVQATHGAWVPAPLPLSMEVVRVRDVDRALWRRRPDHEHRELENVRRAGKPTATLTRADDSALYHLLAKSQRLVRFTITSAWSQNAEGPEIDAKVTPGLYTSGDGRREFRATSVAPLPDAATVAMLALLSQVKPSLVRWCPYRESERSAPCDRFFLGVKSQRWCRTHRDIVRRAQLQAAQARHRQGASRTKPETRKLGGHR